MRAGEGAAIRGIADAVAVDVLGIEKGLLLVAGHLYGEVFTVAGAAGEVEGRRGPVKNVTPVIVSLQDGSGSVTAGADRALIEVRSDRGGLVDGIWALFAPVPVDATAQWARIRYDCPGGRRRRPCVRAERDLVRRGEGRGFGPAGPREPGAFIEAGLVEGDVLGRRVVQPAVQNGASGELAAVAHDAAIVGLAVDPVVPAVLEAQEVPELMHEGAGLLINGAHASGVAGDRPPEAAQRDDRIVPADFRAA